MNVLVVGSGGREHALAWALARSSPAPRIFALPGNPGMARLGSLLAGDPLDAADILDAVRERAIDLVVIGPEMPLVAGLADRLASAGVRVFGPRAAAARIEGSKIFAKELMRRAGVPTASFHIAEEALAAKKLAETLPLPLVVKADGLAAGKGAIVVCEREEARRAIEALMVERCFGAAGDRVIFEEFLEGEEMSVFAIASGEQYRLLPTSQDHKRAYDGDRGPNTGGMGAYAPVLAWDAQLERRVRGEVIEPVLRTMSSEGCAYSGLLYCGLMVKEGAPRVVEFNCRFGDPETQAVVPILSGDLLDALWAASDPEGRASLPEIAPDGRSAVCVVLASAGYPGASRAGLPIRGIGDAEERCGALVFHASTRPPAVTMRPSAWRVLGVVGVGADAAEARARAYAGVDAIAFEGAFCRRDIALAAAEWAVRRRS